MLTTLRWYSVRGTPHEWFQSYLQHCLRVNFRYPDGYVLQESRSEPAGIARASLGHILCVKFSFPVWMILGGSSTDGILVQFADNTSVVVQNSPLNALSLNLSSTMTHLVISRIVSNNLFFKVCWVRQVRISFKSEDLKGGWVGSGRWRDLYVGFLTHFGCTRVWYIGCASVRNLPARVIELTMFTHLYWYVLINLHSLHYLYYCL